MRWFPGLLPSSLIAVSFFLPQPEPISPKADPSVRIESLRSIGSGTHIGNGIILTVAHVVANGGLIEVLDQDGNVYPASVSYFDEASDVATLQIETNPPIQSLDIDCRAPRLGEAIVTTGNPMGDHFIWSWGRVSGKERNKDTVTVFPMDMTTIPGMSGGSVRDWFGHIIGLVSMVMVQPMFGVPLHVGYAVPSSTFCPLLKEAGVL